MTYGIYYAQIVCYAVYLLMSSTQVCGVQEVAKVIRTRKREEEEEGKREGEEGEREGAGGKREGEGGKREGREESGDEMVCVAVV